MSSRPQALPERHASLCFPSFTGAKADKYLKFSYSLDQLSEILDPVSPAIVGNSVVLGLISASVFMPIFHELGHGHGGMCTTILSALSIQPARMTRLLLGTLPVFKWTWEMETRKQRETYSAYTPFE